MEDETRPDEPMTIAKLGRLWMGNPDTESTSLKFKDWDFEQEEQLADLLQKEQDRFEGGKIGRRASYILQHLAAEIGGVKLWEENGESWEPCMPLAKRLNVISKLWSTDVLTAFVLLKIHTGEDPKVKFPVADPNDRKNERTVDWEGDLSQLPFEGSPSLNSQLWTYDLKHPIEVMSKQVTKIVFGPTRWSVTEKIEALNHHVRRMNLDQIVGSIWEIPEVAPRESAAPYVKSHLRKVRKVDLNAIMKGIGEDHHAGLDMSIEVYDQEKDRTFTSSVPWYRPDFFDDTSQ